MNLFQLFAVLFSPPTLTESITTMSTTNAYTFDTVDVDAAGKKVASYQATLMLAGMPAGPSITVQPGVEFSLTANVPGSYTVEVSAVDADGALLASPAVSDPFTVSADLMAIPFSVKLVVPATVAVPSTVTPV